MDEKRFDDLTRALADRPGGTVTRRFALKAAAALALGAFGLRGRAGAEVTQAQCGNKTCKNNPGKCTNGCVCCIYANGNSRCRLPGTCSPGVEAGGPTTTTAAPTTTSTTTSTTTTAAPTTTTGSPTTTTTTVAPTTTTSTTATPSTTTLPPAATTTTTRRPVTCGGSCNSPLNELCPSGCVCDSAINGTCVTPPPTCSGNCDPRDGSGCATGCRCAGGVCVASGVGN